MGPIRTRQTTSVGRAELLRLMHARENGALSTSLAASALLCGFERTDEPAQLTDINQDGLRETQPATDPSELPPEPTRVPPVNFALPVFAATFEPEPPREPLGQTISAEALALPRIKAPEKPPLVPWSRLGAFVRSSLSDQTHRHRLDVKRLIRMVSRNEPLVDVPRLPHASLCAPAVVLLDHSDEMMPFWSDLHDLRQKIAAEFGSRVQIQWIQNLPGRRLLQSLPTQCRMLAVSAMGQLESNSIASAAWIRFGDLLVRRGHHPSALVPCPQQRWVVALAKRWRCAVWDRFKTMPRRQGLPAHPTAQHDSGADRLLNLLSPTALVEPGLSRAVRFLLGASSDVGAEYDAYFHQDCDRSSLWFSIRNEETLKRLEQLSVGIANGIVDQTLERRVMELIAAYHRTCSDPVAMDAWVRAASVSERAKADPWVDVSTDQLIAEKLRELAAVPRRNDRTGLVKHWIARIERVPIKLRGESVYAKGTARAYHAGLTKDQQSGRSKEKFDWPEGIDAEVANQELQQLVEIPDRVTEFRLCRREDRMEVVGKETSDLPSGMFPIAEIQTRRLQIHSSYENVNRTHAVNAHETRTLIDSTSSPATLTVTTDTQGVHFCNVRRPEWARKLGLDQFGVYAEIDIDSVSLQLRWIPPGRFIIGDQFDGPEHEVLISEGFWMAATPTTQKLWEVIVLQKSFIRRELKEKPSHFQGERLPVEQVSWEDAVEWCELASDVVTGLTFSLPTEAQWEYACRAGSRTAYHFGDDEDWLANFGWYDKNSKNQTHEVASKAPNRWGLHDLHGNVWEWCLDGQRVYESESVVDPIGPTEQGVDRVVRGGGWFYSAQFCRSAYRDAGVPGYRSYFLGFRLVAGQSQSGTESGHRGAVISLWSDDAVAERPPRFVKIKPYAKPEWASKIWEDEFGELAAFEVDGVEFQLRKIPAGSFRMGSPDEEEDRLPSEGPIHQVTISREFWIGTTPVTQQQWLALADENPSSFKGDQRPVEQVSWDDVQFWLKKLGENMPFLPIRLPTDAEWEYACRAGTSTRFHSGDNDDALSLIAWYSGNSGGATHDVGQKGPNLWGLWDMHGNVDEWCLDGKREYHDREAVDPVGPLGQGVDRVVRGGSWFNSALDCRSAFRFAVGPGDRFDFLGFRLVAGHPLPGPEVRGNKSSGGAG